MDCLKESHDLFAASEENHKNFYENCQSPGRIFILGPSKHEGRVPCIQLWCRFRFCGWM